MSLYIEQSGHLDRCPYSQTLIDRATQLFIKYKIGALVAQYQGLLREKPVQGQKKPCCTQEGCLA